MADVKMARFGHRKVHALVLKTGGKKVVKEKPPTEVSLFRLLGLLVSSTCILPTFDQEFWIWDPEAYLWRWKSRPALEEGQYSRRMRTRRRRAKAKDRFPFFRPSYAS